MVNSVLTEVFKNSVKANKLLKRGQESILKGISILLKGISDFF